MLNAAAKPSLLIVVPVYNHAASLPAVLADLAPLGLPVLVVDDGSQPPVAAMCQDAGVEVVVHAANAGKGAAIMTGIRYGAARGYAAVLTFDADGQHLAADIPALVAAHLAAPTALIIGERDFTAPASGAVPGSSRFGRRFSNFWIWVETGARLGDTQSGLRVYPVDLPLLATVQGKRYAFEIEVISRSLWQGRRVIGVPVGVYYPPRGERISHFHGWTDNFRLSRTHTWLCTLRVLGLLRLYRPLRLPPSATAALPKSQSQLEVGVGAAATRAERVPEVRGMGLTAWAIGAFGARVAYLLLPFPILSTFAWRRRERRAMLEFYRSCRPGWPPLRRLFGALHNYAMFAASIIDRTRPEGFGLVHDQQYNYLRGTLNGREGRGMIVLGAHYGDWMLIARKLQPYLAGPMGLVLDPGVTPRFFAELEAQFRGFLRLIDPHLDGLSFALAVKEILDAGGTIAFLADRVSEKGGATLEQPFLGRQRRWPRAPFALATRLGVPVFFVCAAKQNLQPSAQYQVNLTQLWDGQGRVAEAEVLQRFARALEDQVVASPQHWFNFSPFWPEVGGS